VLVIFQRFKKQHLSTAYKQNELWFDLRRDVEDEINDITERDNNVYEYERK